MKIENCDLSDLADLMWLNADELDAFALRELLVGTVVDTDELDADAWAVCLSDAKLDVLRLDPIWRDDGTLFVMQDDCMLCTLDPENYPAEIDTRLRPHYDALVEWAEARGLFQDVAP